MTSTPPVPKDPLAGKRYDILLVDCPWGYYGSSTKMGAAGKHYSLMGDADIKNLPIKKVLKKKAWVFVWATGPKLDLAIESIKAWGLHYRGIAHVWVKSRKSDGAIIHGQGVPPTYSKPTSELLLVATTTKVGRPLKLLNSAIPQIVLSPREGHSQKPSKFRTWIETGLVGQGNPKGYSLLEVFARKVPPGWDAIGDGVRPGEDVKDSLEKIIDE